MRVSFYPCHINKNSISSLLLFFLQGQSYHRIVLMKWNDICENYFVNSTVKIRGR